MFLLHALIDPVRSSPKMCRSNQVQSHAMPIVDIMILGALVGFLSKMGIKYNALTIDFIDNKTASEFSTCDVLVISNANDEKIR